MKWLAQNRPELIAAEFALNEGGGGRSDGKGNLAIANIHVGEKAAVNYRIEATNPGGHSSAPVRDNAIYELSDALGRLRAYDFPLQMSDTTRAYFRVAGKARGDAMGAAMQRIAADPTDKAAETLLNTDKAITRCCARPASRRCWTAAMPIMRCRSAPAPTSTAASSPASRPKRCARR